jgi:hypothetical protein
MIIGTRVETARVFSLIFCVAQPPGGWPTSRPFLRYTHIARHSIITTTTDLSYGYPVIAVAFTCPAAYHCIPWVVRHDYQHEQLQGIRRSNAALRKAP